MTEPMSEIERLDRDNPDAMNAARVALLREALAERRDTIDALRSQLTAAEARITEAEERESATYDQGWEEGRADLIDAWGAKAEAAMFRALAAESHLAASQRVVEAARELSRYCDSDDWHMAGEEVLFDELDSALATLPTDSTEPGESE